MKQTKKKNILKKQNVFIYTKQTQKARQNHNKLNELDTQKHYF